VAFASSLDQIGPLSASVKDAAILLEVISGPDKRDATSADNPVEEFAAWCGRDVQGMRIGIAEEYFEPGLNDHIKSRVYEVIDFLKSNGAIISDIHLPHSKYGVSTYYVIATAEASSNLARYDGIKYGYRSKNEEDLLNTYSRTRSDGFGEEVKRRIMLGTYVLSSGYYDAYYRKAQQMRRLIKNDFDRVFSEIDCLLTPTTPGTAFKIGEKTDNPLEMYLSDVYTVNANLAGIPAISLPVGTEDTGLPIGLQLMTAPFKEGKLIQVGDFIEQNFPENEQ
jgi:aspartyl-tRNA(Asn)/glutamyl-tRNA(Gln) amidotransferase subunit A